MLASTGNINQHYVVIGIVHASISRPVKKTGCGAAGGLPTQEAYEATTKALQQAALASGGNAVINIGYDHRVSTSVGCGNQAEPNFEVYGWGTAIRLEEQ